MFTLANQPVPAVGQPAPDFQLASTAGREIALGEFRGREPVLLAFFPLAFTSVCTAEVCAFSDDLDQFAARGVTVLPISVDSVATLLEFKHKHQLKVELLSDFKRDVTTRYGVLHPERFYASRAYFLVDRDGIVRWAHVEANPGQRRENAELLAQIAALA